MKTNEEIKEVCQSLEKFLQEKNRRYGDSAIHPVRIFSNEEVDDQILVRIDDKLSRIGNNKGELRMNDVVDLMGYLVLLCVAMGWTDFEELID